MGFLQLVVVVVVIWIWFITSRWVYRRLPSKWHPLNRGVCAALAPAALLIILVLRFC